MAYQISLIDIQDNLLEWFVDNGRHWIPWKLNNQGSIPSPQEVISPYGIWIAEVMLQQTQLDVVIPFWEKWMMRFPNLSHLSEVDLEEVLLLWQGLGYYARARRVHCSSKLLIKFIEKNNCLDYSSWPIKLDEWMALPGVGRSTAGSIISSAFDLPLPILDGNVKRIFSRLIASQKTPTKDAKRLWQLSTDLVRVNSPRNFNQALMDLGSTICTPRNPSCSICPLQNFCLAFLKYDPNNFPKKIMKSPIPFEEIGIGIIFNNDGKILIDQRLENASMGGMWEFPGGKKDVNEKIEKTIEREIMEELGISIEVGDKLLSLEHAYSHKKLLFTVHFCKLISGNPKPLKSQKLLWISPARLFDFPFPAANTKIIHAIHKHLDMKNSNQLNR